MWTNRWLAAAVLIGSTITTAGPAFADYPGPTVPPPSVGASRVARGATDTFTAGGFATGTTVTVMDNGRVVGTAVAGPNGVFVLTLRIADCGANKLTAAGTGLNGTPFSVAAKVTGLCGNGDGDRNCDARGHGHNPSRDCDNRGRGHHPPHHWRWWWQ